MAEETLSAPQAPLSPLKIPPQEYSTTPTSSGATSPAEGRAKGALEHQETWESAGTSEPPLNSPTNSEPQWEKENGVNRLAGSEADSTGGVNTHGRMLELQSLVRSMQHRLHFLQMILQQATPQEKSTLCARMKALAAGGGVGETSKLAWSCLSPIQKALDSPVVDKLQKRALFSETSDVKSLDLAPSSPSGVSDPPSDASAEDDGEPEVSSSSEGEDPPALTTLLGRIQLLQSQLEESAGENRRLCDAVQQLTEENARLQAQTACKSSAHDLEPPRVEKSEDVDDAAESAATAIFGEPSAFQLVLEEDLSILKNHERCQHKMHELWETIRTLKTFVETYEFEKNAMKIQRDEAIASAERAEADNAKLAGSSNPQQKIKYLQQVKKDNQALRRKIRQLNVRVVGLNAQSIRQKHRLPVEEDEETQAEQDPASLAETLQKCDDRFERDRNQILRGMWQRDDALAEKLARLRLERLEFPESSETRLSLDSKRSRGSSMSNESSASRDGAQNASESWQDASSAFGGARIAHAVV